MSPDPTAWGSEPLARFLNAYSDALAGPYAMELTMQGHTYLVTPELGGDAIIDAARGVVTVPIRTGERFTADEWIEKLDGSFSVSLDELAGTIRVHRS